MHQKIGRANYANFGLVPQMKTNWRPLKTKAASTLERSFIPGYFKNRFAKTRSALIWFKFASSRCFAMQIKVKQIIFSSARGFLRSSGLEQLRPRPKCRRGLSFDFSKLHRSYSTAFLFTVAHERLFSVAYDTCIEHAIHSLVLHLIGCI